MRRAIMALIGAVLAGGSACAQPVEGRLKAIQDTATLRIAYRSDSRPFAHHDAQGRPTGYTIELCERVAKSLERQFGVKLAINTGLAEIFRSGDIVELYTKYFSGLARGASNWVGAVFIFGGLPD